MNAIISDNSRKPDPDEPWRYECPDCRVQVVGSVSSIKWRCNSCGSFYNFYELWDKKKRGVVIDSENGSIESGGTY